METMLGEGSSSLTGHVPLARAKRKLPGKYLGADGGSVEPGQAGCATLLSRERCAWKSNFLWVSIHWVVL